jgi:hypothetical protein
MAGSINAIKTPIMAITTSNSTSVKARRANLTIADLLDLGMRFSIQFLNGQSELS